jgi:hypothetical protein
MSTDRDTDYEVGWGKTPRHTRFKKGQSGNPKGRAPGSKNLATLLNEALSEPVVVTENGQRKTITKMGAAIKQLVNKAASGDHRSIQLLFVNQIPLVEAALESARSKTAEAPLPPGLSMEERRARALAIAEVLKEVGGRYPVPGATPETQSSPVAAENSKERGNN